ncbi:hypothetical protein LCGC14_1150830 [marine sediment metagenome]|uniref:Uncharacterized protein n=1 Tax=marine sediment metagenome TaxID=412755 RepID=A0A0F9Q134_9ZZZZ
MNEVIVGWIGIFIGWILTLLYMKGKLWQFPFYNRIISWVYSNPVANSLSDTEEFLTNLRDAIVDQILNNQPQLFNAIAKQRIILANQKREPVAIFLSVITFKALLRKTLSDDNLDEVDSLYDALQGLDMPIGHLGILPIYVTELLVDAPVFVAGGISWTFDR